MAFCGDADGYGEPGVTQVVTICAADDSAIKRLSATEGGLHCDKQYSERAGGKEREEAKRGKIANALGTELAAN